MMLLLKNKIENGAYLVGWYPVDSKERDYGEEISISDDEYCECW